MSAQFYLETRSEYDKARAVPIRLRLTWNRRRRLSVALPIKAAPKHWSQSRARLKPSAPGATEINGSLDRLHGFAQSLMLEGLGDDVIRQRLLERIGRGETRKEKPLLAYYDDFVTAKEARTTASTMETYHALRRHLASHIRADYAPSDVGPAFLDDLTSHLLHTGLTNSTTNKLVTRTKTFLRWLVKREVLGHLPTTRSLPTTRNAVVYLTPDELRRFWQADLTDLSQGYEDARSLFTFMVMTGQRFSDVHALTWKAITPALQWWNLTTKKTALTTRIPLPTPARKLLESRRGERHPLPKLTNQKCNVFLKEICRRAGIDEPVTVTRQRGGERETETLPKWELITTKAGRKTFVTLFLQDGHPLTDLLGLTHEDIRQVRPYAGVDDTKRKKRVEQALGGLK